MTLILGINAQAAVEQPISFLQGDSKWGSELYTATGSRSQTIATSGCGPTSMAMVLNYYVDDSITPIQTAIYAVENHHRTSGNGTSWGYFGEMANEYDLEFIQTASSVEALEWMNTQEDPLVICSMGPGLWTRQGHFIVLWDVENGVAHINDPASTSQPRTENSYNYMASQCKQYFCFNLEPKPQIVIEEELIPVLEVAEASIIENENTIFERLEATKEKLESPSMINEFQKQFNSYLFQNYS